MCSLSLFPVPLPSLLSFFHAYQEGRATLKTCAKTWANYSSGVHVFCMGYASVQTTMTWRKNGTSQVLVGVKHDARVVCTLIMHMRKNGDDCGGMAFPALRISDFLHLCSAQVQFASNVTGTQIIVHTTRSSCSTPTSTWLMAFSLYVCMRTAGIYLYVT